MRKKRGDAGSSGYSVCIGELAGETGFGSYVRSQREVIASREPLRLSIGGRVVGEGMSWEDCWRRIDEAFRAMQPYNNQETWLQVFMVGADGSLLGRSIVAALWEACCEDPWLFHLHMEGLWVVPSETDRT